MANTYPYIQVKDATTGSKYKRISVLWTDFLEGPVSQQIVERSANGKLLVSIGKTYRSWKGVFKIDAIPKKYPTDCTANCTWEYAGKADIEKWCTSDNPLHRQLTIKDNYNAQHEVFIVSTAEFRYASPVPDGVGSFFLIPFEMHTQSGVSL